MLADLVPSLALVVLLAVAYRHPRGLVEAGAGAVAVAATYAVGALPGTVVRREVDHLLPVVGFLMAILVVADRCRAAGVFGALGTRLAGRRPATLLALTFATATAVTVLLSLDATVVLLTPVVVAAAGTFLAGELACVRLANSASLLVPVANLTNLLALPALGLTFGHFAVLMAPTWLVVLAVEYVVLRALLRRSPPTPVPAPVAALPAVPLLPVITVLAMLGAFVLTSPLGLEPAWVAGAAALVLVVRDLAGRRLRLGHAVAGAHPSFAFFVLCLGLVVAALGRGWLGDAVAPLVPSYPTLPGLLVVAALGGALANALNNLPATLLLVPLVAPTGTVAVLALLVGINVGSSMTWTGSLANLLWRRSLLAEQHPVPGRAFHLVGLVAAPTSIVLGVVVLDGWARLVG